jgi:hypothetical protein
MNSSQFLEVGKYIIALEIKLLSEYNGKTCSSCGLIQGLPNDGLGVNIWYCDWVYKKVNKKLKKIKERIYQKILSDSFKDLNSLNIS